MKLVAKVAVSIPRSLLVPVERVRARLGKSRSAVVTEALDEWLKSHSVDDSDRRYAQAYLRDPERVEEESAVALGAIAAWEPWE